MTTSSALEGDRDSGEPRPPVRQADAKADAGHRWRDILIQVALITVSVIVALAFDGLVAMWGHRALVNEARANLAAELQDNRKELALVLRRMGETDEQLKRALAAAAARLDGQQPGEGAAVAARPAAVRHVAAGPASVRRSAGRRLRPHLEDRLIGLPVGRSIRPDQRAAAGPRYVVRYLMIASC